MTATVFKEYDMKQNSKHLSCFEELEACIEELEAFLVSNLLQFWYISQS